MIWLLIYLVGKHSFWSIIRNIHGKNICLLAQQINLLSQQNNFVTAENIKSQQTRICCANKQIFFPVNSILDISALPRVLITTLNFEIEIEIIR